MCELLKEKLRTVRDKLLEQPVSPRVETPADINNHYCQYVAETVTKRLNDTCDVEIVADGGGGYGHTWLMHDGRHYDAECVEGVADYRELPFFQRHPEAAVHVEPGSVDLDSVRDRGMKPLYPSP